MKATPDAPTTCHRPRGLIGLIGFALDRVMMAMQAFVSRILSVTDADTLAKHRSAIMTGMMRAFAARKIEFAYPTQVAFTAAPDGTLHLTYYGPAPADAALNARTLWHAVCVSWWSRLKSPMTATPSVAASARATAVS